MPLAKWQVESPSRHAMHRASGPSVSGRPLSSDSAFRYYYYWQASGRDVGSTVNAIPADEIIIGWAREMLGF